MNLDAAAIKEMETIKAMLEEARKLPPEERIDMQCRLFANYLHRHGRRVPDNLRPYLNH